MDYLNGISIKEVIESIKSNVQILNTSLEDNECYADKTDPKLCFHCKIKEAIDKNLKLLTEFESITPNTFYSKTYVDLWAFVDALEKNGNPIDQVYVEKKWIDGAYSKDEIDFILVYYSRYAMNGNGYHVGYEDVTFKFKAIPKSRLQLSGIPYNLSAYVIDPDSYEIIERNFPAEELPTIDSHDEDCEVHQLKDHDWKELPYPDECTCGLNENWDGYSHPEDDYFETELSNIISFILQRNKLPSAEFDRDERIWTIGDQVQYEMDTMFD